jgi:hypothetical protein
VEDLGIKQYDIHIDLAILPFIYEVSKTEQSSKRSNRGGYQGQRHNEYSFPWMSSILEQIKPIVGYEFVTYWFNINGPGHYNALHDHGYFGDNLCGCLYLQTPKDSGQIKFVTKTTQVVIEPKVGKLILFPDNLKHEVLANLSNDDRISIAFNFWKM